MKKKNRTGSRPGSPATGGGAPRAMGIGEALDVAMGHHRAGNLDAAESIYRQVLGFQPGNAAALHLLGVVNLQKGRLEAALDLMDRALAAKPDLVEAHCNRGNVLRELGRTAEAEKSYRKAIGLNGSFAMAHYNLGGILLADGRFETAAEHFRKALATAPGIVEARVNLGLACKELGRLPEAETCYRQALEARPDLAVAHYNLGNVLLETGRAPEAVSCYERALAREPGYAQARLNLAATLRDLGRLEEAETAYLKALEDAPGNGAACIGLGAVLRDLGRPGEAESWYRKALEIDPALPLAHFNLGNALREQGRLEEATASYRRAVELDPGTAGYRVNLGNALRDGGKPGDSIPEYRQALELEPGNAEALVNLGNAFKETGNPEQAISSYGQALAIRPDLAEVHFNLGTVYQDLFLTMEAAASFRRALELKPDHLVARSNLLMNLQYDPTVTPETILAESRKWENTLKIETDVLSGARHEPDPEVKLRIGYVSGDLRRHPVGYFLDGVLASHDRDRFQVFCYASQSFGDDLTERLRANSDAWRAVFGMADHDLEARIREDGINILVDLAGHTARNRLAVFCRRPAPVRATWAGYVGATGLSAMDYLISDDRETPAGTDRWYGETVVRLPDCYVCYTPPDYAPPVAPLPALRNGFVTFGCFNNLAKINGDVIALWTELLRALPGARLLMVTKGLDHPLIGGRYRDAFAAGGVGDRVDFTGMVPHGDLLARYGEVDVALDPFPYSGGLTTLESLWMGVPVITLGGDRFASRHTLSHLTAAGLPELIAENGPEYVSKAVALARDLPRLAALRSSLRERMAASPLCDAPRFTRNLEQAYRAMWRNWCEKRKAPSGE